MANNSINKIYLALDLGASNGRCIAGSFDGKTLTLDTLTRFDNCYISVRDHSYWNILELYRQIEQSLRKAATTFQNSLCSLAVDTWGVDFALLDRHGDLLSNPLIARDPHTEGILDEAFKRMPKEVIFETTGIMFLRMNTLFQLLALVIRKSPILEIAQTYLMMPDLLNYWLTGRAVCEYTIASTSHMLNARSKQWAYHVIEAMGIPEHIFPPIVQPGQVLEMLDWNITEETGLLRLPVIASSSHDTASAVASVPAKTDNYFYLSSGTWALLGAELREPVITKKVMDYHVTNEGGVFNTIRLLRDISSLWLLQECKRIWTLEGDQYNWNDLVLMAEKAEPFMAYINPEAEEFVLPTNMPQAIQKACRRMVQNVPQSKGEIVRVCMESLAFTYRYTFDQLVDIIGRRPEVLHMVGGGIQNKLLNQFTANVINLPVIAGPVEAAALGNVIMQMIAIGDLGSLAEGRNLVGTSFPTETYTPMDVNLWEDKYQGFLKTLKIPPIT
jgi:rhamnulokinase